MNASISRVIVPTGMRLIAVAAVAWDATRPSMTAQDRDIAASAFAHPVRSDAHRPRSFDPIELPPVLVGVPALTLELEVGRRDGDRTVVQRKTFTRTSDRVHVSTGSHSPEWLFVQNPVDRRRVSATMIDHANRILIEYDESELRNAGLGRGWADVVSFGVGPEALAELEPTGRHEWAHGARFGEKSAANGAKRPIAGFWWSDELAAPLRMSTGEAGARFELITRSLRLEADPRLVTDPRVRHPTYAVMDVADYREKHHEKAHDGHD